MLLTLLIVSQAAGEWVEISQQHYRKPMRTHTSHNPFTTPDRIEFEDTTKTWIYNNKSVSNYDWVKAPILQTSPANIERASSQNIVTTVQPIRSQENDSEEDEFVLRPNYGSTRPKGMIERVPNVGNVKRVHLNNSPVKSPAVNIKGDSELRPKNRYEELPLNNEKEEEIFENKKILETRFNTRRIYLNKLKNQHNTESTSTFPTDDIETPSLENIQIMKTRPKPELKNRTNLPNIFSPKPTFITEREDFIFNENNENNLQKGVHKKIHATENKQMYTTQPNEEISTERGKKYNNQLSAQSYSNYDTKKLDDQTRDVNKNPQSTRIEAFVQGNAHNQENIGKDNQTTSKEDSKPANPVNNETPVSQDKEKKGNQPQENPPGNKINNMENLLKLMKAVTDTISQNTRRSFGGKMRYLHQLKDSILANIAARIDATWPDDDLTTPHRHSRSAHASPRGHHVHFPSSESALMTISFLTFAVFLIKLVLQIIQTYKNKAMMVAPVMVAAAGRHSIVHGHH